ncbi:MAG: hypothetical protein HYS23_06425 [Geobacter sp.]|nr:hypothetical protein [Geobacter sp.]
MNCDSVRHLSWREQTKILLLFVLLACVYIIPATKGVPAGDGYGNYHGFWWFRKALLSFRNPFYSDYFYYPQGANLAFYGGASFAGFLLTLPVSLLAGIHPAIMTAHFLGYVLSGYFTFLLAYELTGSKEGAIVSGLIFAFAPYHFANVPIVMILSSLQWLPLSFWLLKRAFDRLGFGWAVAAGASLALVLYADQMQAIMVALVLLLAPLLVVMARREAGENRAGWADNRRRLALILLVAGGTALAFSSPYLYAFADFVLHSPETLKVGHFDHGGANQFSADLLAFVLPPTYHPLWGGLFENITPFSRDLVFLGFTPMLLAAVGVTAFWQRTAVRWIFLVTVIVFVLSLGPTLHVMGKWQWENGIIQLPYSFTADWPVLGNIRTPYRFQPLTMLGIALLAGYGLMRIRQKMGDGPWRNRAVIILAGVVLLEFLPGTIDYPVAGKPPALYEAITQDKDDYAILEIPLSRWDGFTRNGSACPGRNLYYQSIHGKRVFSGFMSRTQDYSLEFDDVILDTIKDWSTYENYIVIGAEKRTANPREIDSARAAGRSLSEVSGRFIRKYRIRYIVVHPPLSYKGSLSRAFVESFTGMPLIEAPNDGIAYVKVQ